MLRYTKILATSVLVLAVAGTAGASLIVGGQQIPNGPLVVKFVNYDVGSTYSVSNGLYSGEAALNALPQTSPPGGLPGEDNWAIFRVESIQDASQTITYYHCCPRQSRHSRPPGVSGLILAGFRDFGRPWAFL